MFDGAGPFVQSGWVVRDLDEAMNAWLAKGSGPFLARRNLKRVAALHRGAPIEVDLHLAFAQMGGIQIELIEQVDDGPSCYRDVFPDGAPGGPGGFHHLAMLLPNYEKARSACLQASFVEATSAIMDGTRLSYFDTRDQFGFMLEIVEATSTVGELFELVSSVAKDWNGKDPIREIS